MDMSSYFPSDVLNKFNTPLLFVTSHNLDKNAKAIEPTSYSLVEPKLQHLYNVTPFIIDTIAEAGPVSVKHQSRTQRILAEKPRHILCLHTSSLAAQPRTPMVRIGRGHPDLWCPQNRVSSNLKPYTT